MQLAVRDHGEGRDDDQVSHGGPPGRRAVQRNNSASALAADCVGDEPLAIVDVPDVDLLVLANIGDLEQILVDRARPLVVQFAVGHRRAVDLRFQEMTKHDWPAGVIPRSL
jgi:hypothetical protein